MAATTTTTTLSPEEHVAIVQELFTLDEAVCKEITALAANRAGLATKMLSLMVTTDMAKKKGLTTVDAMKAACMASKKHADVIGVQGMFCSICGLKPPPIMLGVFWLL